MRYITRGWRDERGSQGISAAGAALAAAMIVAALLGVAQRMGTAVDYAMECAAGVLEGGAVCSGDAPQTSEHERSTAWQWSTNLDIRGWMPTFASFSLRSLPFAASGSAITARTGLATTQSCSPSGGTPPDGSQSVPLPEAMPTVPLLADGATDLSDADVANPRQLMVDSRIPDITSWEEFEAVYGTIFNFRDDWSIEEAAEKGNISVELATLAAEAYLLYTANPTAYANDSYIVALAGIFSEYFLGQYLPPATTLEEDFARLHELLALAESRDLTEAEETELIDLALRLGVQSAVEERLGPGFIPINVEASPFAPTAAEPWTEEARETRIAVTTFLRANNVPSRYWRSIAQAYGPGAYVVVLNEPLPVYRYSSDTEHSSGRWLTTEYIADPARRVTDLALPPDNTAVVATSWEIPDGTMILVGTVAPLYEQPGGGTQIYIADPSVLQGGAVCP